jgi:DNA-binding XRE family transcriptional regulator
MTQDDLASELGVSKQHLSRIETGKASPGKVLARVILSVTVGWGEPIELTEWVE